MNIGEGDDADFVFAEKSHSTGKCLTDHGKKQWEAYKLKSPTTRVLDYMSPSVRALDTAMDTHEINDNKLNKKDS